MVYHYLDKFGGYRDFGSRDKMFLVCYVIKLDHIIKGSDD